MTKTHEQVQPHDADALAPDHVEGHDAAQDRETAGCPRDFDSHDARRAPGQHPPARQQDQRVQAFKEKAVNLVDARARLWDPDAMEVGYYGHYEEEYDNDDPEDEIVAVTEDIRCCRCQGYGHRASDCAPPAKEKGKNKGFKGDGKGKGLHGDHKGKGKGSKGDGKARVMGRARASICSAPTAGNVDMLQPIAGLCTLTRCRGRRLRILRRKTWPSAELVSTWVLWT